MSVTSIQPFISIIIPCYNEEKNLRKGKLEEVYRYLTKQKYVWELIIVDDESTDLSKSLVRDFIHSKESCALYEIQHGGKPAAVWEGIRRAQGEIVLFTDMDQSAPLSELEKLLYWYDRGFDVVIGSRSPEREGLSVLRKIGSFVFRNLRSLVLLRNIYDTQCGFKSCRRYVALEVFPQLHYFRQKKQPSGWKVSAYDVELLFIMEKMGYSIKEVVVQWSDRDQSDTKGRKGDLIRYLRESVEMAEEVLRVKLNQSRGLYEQK